MTNSFSHLEILIGAALQQQSLPSADRNIDDIVFQIDHEKERILTTIHDQENIEVYVQNRQHQLVRLIDLMLASCPVIAMDSVYKNIYHLLLFMLQYLETYFAAYMDEDCKIPYNYLLKVQFDLSAELRNLELEFDISEADTKLRGLLTAPFYKLISVRNQHYFYSYYDIVYLRRLMAQLLKTPYTSWDEGLLSFDFNDPDYVNFMIEMIRSEFIDIPDAGHKKHTLLEWQRVIRQVAVIPGMCYKKLHPSVKEQLLCWITEEISGENKERGVIDPWKDFRIPTTFTVLQLGRFIGMLLEAGIIQSENKKELALFISIFFVTPQRDYISPASIRRSFYNKDVDLSESMRNILSELINISKKQ
jgi:hypothetical protein